MPDAAEADLVGLAAVSFGLLVPFRLFLPAHIQSINGHERKASIELGMKHVQVLAVALNTYICTAAGVWRL